MMEKMERWMDGQEDARIKKGQGDNGSEQASLLKTPNQHNKAATQQEPEDEKAVTFSYFVRTLCVMNGYENQLSNKIRFPQQYEFAI